MIFHVVFMVFFHFMVVRTAPIGIPTSEQQGNLILSVQEIFEELKSLLQDETAATEISIMNDVEKIVRRAKNHLLLVDELALAKLSQSTLGNTISLFDVKPEINKLTKSGIEQLDRCINMTKEATRSNTIKISNETERALNNGEMLLDSLWKCSKLSTLNLLMCYKDVIMHEVLPVKKLMTSAIKAHKIGHIQYIKLRDKANECVDEIIEEHDLKVAYILNKHIVN